MAKETWFDQIESLDAPADCIPGHLRDCRTCRWATFAGRHLINGEAMFWCRHPGSDMSMVAHKNIAAGDCAGWQ